MATNWHEDFDPKFASKLFWNDFSYRSKVSGNVTAKSDYEFTVKGIQIIQKRIKRLYMECCVKIFVGNFFNVEDFASRYYNEFEKEFLERGSFLSSLVKRFTKSKFLIKNDLFYINHIYWIFWKYRNTPLMALIIEI